MEQTHDTTPAQTAPATPTTAQASKTQAKKTPEPSSEADFLKELKLRVHEAQCTPSMLLVPKVEMQGSTDAKLRVASRFLLGTRRAGERAPAAAAETSGAQAHVGQRRNRIWAGAGWTRAVGGGVRVGVAWRLWRAGGAR